jgi:protein-disulfide isomerase
LQTDPLLDEAFIRTGKAKHVYVNYPLDSLHPTARAAAEAIQCVGKQSAAAYWEMYTFLFETGSEWGSLPDATEFFKEFAADQGLDVAAFESCVKTKETSSLVQSEIDRAMALGFRGTPAFLINDWVLSGAQPFEQFQDRIERALRGEHPPPTPTPLPPGKTPFDANPDRPGYTYGGDAYTGSAEAPMVMVAFIDFGSEANLSFLKETWPSIEKDYVTSGEMRYTVKHFPAAVDTASTLAAVASECAGLQGDFWQMHDLLFEKQSEWKSAEDVRSVLAGYTRDMGLDSGTFEACLQEGEAVEKVNQDVAIAMSNQFPAAPQFFAFKGQQGGYVPLENMREVLDSFAE